MVARAIEAGWALARHGVQVRVVEMHTIKPLDTGFIAQCALETGAIVTREEHSIVGGLGGAVAEWASQRVPVPVECVGVNDTFTESGPYPDLLEKYGRARTQLLPRCSEPSSANRQAYPKRPVRRVR